MPVDESEFSALDHIQTIRWLITTKVNIAQTYRVYIPAFKNAHALSEDELLHMAVDMLYSSQTTTKRDFLDYRVKKFSGYETKRLVHACKELTTMVTRSEDLNRKKLPVWFRTANLSSHCEDMIRELFWCFSMEPIKKDKEKGLLEKFSSMVNWGVFTVVSTQVISTLFLWAVFKN